MKYHNIQKHIVLILCILLLFSQICCRKQDKDFSSTQDDRHFIVAKWRYGFIDRDGNEVIEPQYSFVSRFWNGHAVVISKERYILIDVNGNTVLAPKEYKLLYGPNDGRLLVAKNKQGLFGFITLDGNIAIPFAYDAAFGFNEGRAAVKQKGKWGYIDAKGNVVVDCKYDTVFSFSESRAVVIKDRKWGYIDPDGNEVIPLSYHYASSFSEGLACISTSEKDQYYIDSNGAKVIVGSYQVIRDFHEGLAAVKHKGQDMYGFIRKDGSMAIQPQFSSVDHFSNGLCAVIAPKRETKLGKILGRDAKKQVGYIDKRGNFRITLDPESVDDVKMKIGGRTWRTFENGLAWVVTEEKQGCINTQGEWVWSHPTDTDDQIEPFMIEEQIDCDDPEKRLWAAVKSENMKVIKEVLSKQPELSNDHIHTAAETCNIDVINLLIESGADVNKHTDFGGYTPLHTLASSKKTESSNAIIALIEAGAEIEAKDHDGDTPLHGAISSMMFKGHRDYAVNIARTLLEKGASCNTKNNDGDTPLHYAVIFSLDPVMIHLLLKNGADPNTPNNEGKTPLMIMELKLSKTSKAEKVKWVKNQEIINLLKKSESK